MNTAKTIANKPLKSGTKIEVLAFAGDAEVWRPARIAPTRKWMKLGELQAITTRGTWYPIRFDDGGDLLCNSERFRVVESRA